MRIFKVLAAASLVPLLNACVTPTEKVSSATENQTTIEVLNNGNDLAQGSLMFGAIFSGQAYSEMEKAAKKLDTVFGMECSSSYDIRKSPAIVVKPVKLVDAYDDPVEGAWIYRYQAVRCDKKKIYNLLAVAKGNGEIKYTSIFPGNTAASLLLQKDTGPIAVFSTTSKTKKYFQNKQNGICKTGITVFDTKFLRKIPSKLMALTAAWEERWTIDYCGERISTIIEFQPDGVGGTNIQAKHDFDPDQVFFETPKNWEEVSRIEKPGIEIYSYKPSIEINRTELQKKSYMHQTREIKFFQTSEQGVNQLEIAKIITHSAKGFEKRCKKASMIKEYKRLSSKQEKNVSSVVIGCELKKRNLYPGIDKNQVVRNVALETPKGVAYVTYLSTHPLRKFGNILKDKKEQAFFKGLTENLISSNTN